MKEALSSLLYLQCHSILPENNLLPDSYEAGLKIIKPFLVEPVMYHACPNDCVLFSRSTLTYFSVPCVTRRDSNLTQKSHTGDLRTSHLVQGCMELTI